MQRAQNETIRSFMTEIQIHLLYMVKFLFLFCVGRFVAKILTTYYVIRLFDETVDFSDLYLLK